MPRAAAAAVRHLTPAELAERLGMSEGHLANWRSQGKGPAYIRTADTRQSSIRYREADIEAWEESRLIRPNAEAVPA